jgi:glycerol kinase
VSTAGRVLVVDVGTSSVRAAVVRSDGSFAGAHERELLPDSPADGLVEFDAALLASTCVDLARAALEHDGPVDAVGISDQRGSTIVWDRDTGAPIGPGLGWQDLRTVGACLALRAEGVRVGPNQSATKVQWLLDQLDDRGRAEQLCFGTVDTWVAWALSDGAVHVTDATNAAVTGLQNRDASGWDEKVLATVGVPLTMMPAIIDSAGFAGEARALPGAPPITALVGDQQASLVGQGCVRRGDAKITFGTGGMLDVVLDETPPPLSQRNEHGTFPIVAWRHNRRNTWGVEAVMLAAGTNVQWLRDDLGIIASSDESHTLAASCADSGGVVFVPAPLGLGTPAWDYGARAALFGLTRGTGRAEIARAVLEGIAHRGADLIDAAEADSGISIPHVRVDGGMTDNPTFVQALADATSRPVEISPARDATTRGAGLVALVALGGFGAIDAIADTWKPRVRVEPQRALDRDRWREACARAGHWIPELSSIDF